MLARSGLLGFLTAGLYYASVALAATDGLSPVAIDGTKLFNAEGEQFFIKGVIYTNVEVPDMLSKGDQCQVDAGLMKAIGINVVRVYSFDATKNHDDCMNAFQSQGIYVWVDLPSLGPKPKWTNSVYTEWSATVDMFSGYNNTLIFGISIEPPNNGSQPGYLPQVKAAIRDIKLFQEERGYRKIPISYGAVDDPETRVDVADYLTCGDQGTTIDMYGLNVWSWCTNSSYHESGYDKLSGQFEHLDIPVVISESGCGEETRDFADVATMFGPIFETVFSGTVIYQWLNTTGSDGFVNYESGQSTPTTLSNYEVLSTVLSTAVPSSTPLSQYTPSNSPPACPTTDSVWNLAGSVPLPTVSDLDVSTASRLTTVSSGSAAATSSSSSSATTSEASPSAAGAEALSSATSSADADAQRQSQQASLSTGAIAGIAIGGVVVGIAGAIGALFFCWKRRKSAREAQEQEGAPHLAHGDDQYPLQEYTDDDAQSGPAELAVKSSGQAYTQELDAGGFYSATKPHEMIHEARDTPIHEMPHGNGPMHEIDSASHFREIDGRPVISELASTR